LFAAENNIILEPEIDDEFGTQGKIQKEVTSWGATRSTATSSHRTKGSTRIYHKGGGISAARADFQKTGYESITSRINNDGIRVDTKATTSGTITLCTSTSGGQPTLSVALLREKIRYR
jgi:hypothetical protein